MKKFLGTTYTVLLYLFALIGLVLTLGYIAVYFHLTDTAGIVDLQNQAFQEAARNASSTVPIDTAWEQTPEWATLQQAIAKDQGVIAQVSVITGVDQRLIVAQLVVEQLRVYTSEREVFKSVFAPLSILGSQSQFSWGIMGIKEDTAIQIENNLQESTSPYYLGPQYQHLLDFSTDNPTEERFSRLTNEDNHYYDYLYTALYLKQIETQWKNAGFDISDRPEILSTLYNIGFQHSNPNANPSVGGAEIPINGRIYSFGSLAYDFYFSTELTNLFPQMIKK